METAVDWRTHLNDTSVQLHSLLEEPVVDVAWTRSVHGELERLREALEGFAADVANGLYDDVVDHAPRLLPGVRDLREEQDYLHCVVDRQFVLVQRPDSPPEALRSGLGDVVRRLDCHNHRAFGLAVDAYEVDLGGTG